MKYELQSEMKNEKVFHLYDNWNKKLFAFGNEELLITKDLKCISNQKKHSFFNYQGSEMEQINRLLILQFN